jgi:probable HAF family extracellular repeat protein
MIFWLQTHALAAFTNHAFLFTPGSPMQDLGTLGGTASTATAINNSGEVVGYSETTAGNSTTYAFSWTQADGMQNLGTLPGYFDSYALAINW